MVELMSFQILFKLIIACENCSVFSCTTKQRLLDIGDNVTELSRRRGDVGHRFFHAPANGKRG